MLLDLGKMLVMPAEEKSAATVVFEGERAAVNLEGCGNGFQARLSTGEGLEATGQPSAGAGGHSDAGRPPRL